MLAFLSVSIVPLVTQLWNSASSTSQGAVQTNPGDASGNVPTSDNSNEAKLLEDQEKGYQSVVNREPDNETALRGLIETRTQLVQLGKRTPKDLIDPFKKLKDANPEQTDFAILLALTYQQTGDREAAAKTYREVLERNSGNLNALQGLVSLFMREGQSVSAVELLRTTLNANQSQSPEDFDRVSIQLLLGDVYTAQKNFDKALQLYDTLLAQSPEDYRPMVGKALALKAQGKTNDAQTWFDKATDLAPAQFKDQIAQLAQESPAPDPTSP